MPRPSVFDSGHRYVYELRRFREAVAGVPPQPGMGKAGHLQLLRLALLGKPKALDLGLRNRYPARKPRPVDVRYGSGRPRPDAPISPQASVRAADRRRRLALTFTPIEPGDTLPRLDAKRHHAARKRLDPAFARACRTYARLVSFGRAADLEAIAARLRGKAAARG